MKRWLQTQLVALRNLKMRRPQCDNSGDSNQDEDPYTIPPAYTTSVITTKLRLMLGIGRLFYFVPSFFDMFLEICDYWLKPHALYKACETGSENLLNKVNTILRKGSLLIELRDYLVAKLDIDDGGDTSYAKRPPFPVLPVLDRC
ncbi:hypothetical protein F5Y12DRAFT_711223 [Xylaria sp. FL1777]|nr:hypothetical protein F5Y12DRAFT_711223 [Xylaria sp. FL1777]